jgi:hypothetical protein
MVMVSEDGLAMCRLFIRFPSFACSRQAQRNMSSSIIKKKNQNLTESTIKKKWTLGVYVSRVYVLPCRVWTKKLLLRYTAKQRTPACICAVGARARFVQAPGHGATAFI